MKSISLTQEVYLENIFELTHTHEHNHAHIKDIAEKLNVSMASVTEAMTNLALLELIVYTPREPVLLTEKGAEFAKELHKKHKILADFFNLIGCDAEKAENIACKVEHNIDLETAHLIKNVVHKLKSSSS